MLYDYHCVKCNVTWEEIHRMNDRKIPESLSCPYCYEDGYVKQTIVNTNLGMSYSLESVNAFKKLEGSAFQEKLSRIHAGTAGSQLDKQSTITRIQKA